jgi:DNA-directed RNA polymerase specialized sigma24 family protein
MGRGDLLTMTYRELSDFEIDRLTDERLLAYIADCREAEATEAAMTGVRHLIFRHLDTVKLRVAKKVPANLVEDVAHDALVEAISSAFDGRTIKEFWKWLGVIVQRTVADFWRGAKGRQLKLDREGEIGHRVDDDGDDLPDAVGEEGGYGWAELQQVIDSVMAERSELHQQVIDMLVWGGYSAKEVTGTTGVSEANGYQIVRRFRVDLRAALEAEGPTGDTDPGP